MLLRAGPETKGQLGGQLQVMKIEISEDGRLIVNFQTLAKFRGMVTHKQTAHESLTINGSVRLA